MRTNQQFRDLLKKSLSLKKIENNQSVAGYLLVFQDKLTKKDWYELFSTKNLAQKYLNTLYGKVSFAQIIPMALNED